MAYNEEVEEDPVLFDVVESLDISDEEPKKESYEELDFEKADLDNNQVDDFLDMREGPDEESDILE
jgi:hypothetical protein